MPATRSNHVCILLALSIAGCKANVNIGDVTDTNTKDTETTAGGTNGVATDPVTTGSPNTTGGPATDTSDPGSTGSTGKLDTTSPASTGTLDTTSSDTTVAPETTETGADTSTGGGSTTGGPVGGCPNEWAFTRPVTITNEPDKPLSDYQAFVDVAYDDDMNADFSDLRFVDEMGTSLPYWIEDSTAPIDAKLWVRVPTIPAAGDTVIMMCYGNLAAKSTSDGDATFVFFDGFDGNVLDPNKWLATSPVEVSLGALKVLKGAVYSKGAAGTFPNLLVETKARMAQNQQGQEPVLMVSSAQIPAAGVRMGVGGFYTIYVGMPGMVVLDGNLKNNMGCCDSLASTVYGFGLDEGNAYAFALRKFSAFTMHSWKQPFFIGFGYESMKDAADTEIRDMSVEWVLVRKFTSIEPTTVIGPEQMP